MMPFRLVAADGHSPFFSVGASADTTTTLRGVKTFVKDYIPLGYSQFDLPSEGRIAINLDGRRTAVAGGDYHDFLIEL